MKQTLMDLRIFNQIVWSSDLLLIYVRNEKTLKTKTKKKVSEKIIISEQLDCWLLILIDFQHMFMS